MGTATDGDLITGDAAAGPDSHRLPGASVRLRPIPTEGLTRSPDGTRSPAGAAHRSDVVLSLGLTPAGERRVLVVQGLPEADRAAATQALRVFGDDTATALAFADERVAAQQERLLLHRDRTVSGLSEFVVPLLFAVGTGLAGADGLLPDRSHQARTRLRRAADDLDRAIAQVRTVASGIRDPHSPSVTVGAGTDPADGAEPAATQ